MKLNLAGISKESFVDGPGIRFVIFTQGCPHHCKGCHNPQTHSFEGGEAWDIEVLFRQMKENPLQDGITFSGGEPFIQAEALNPLAQKIKEAGMNLWIYSGYTFEQLIQMGERKKEIQELLEKADVLVDGKFIVDERSLSSPFIGSKNQRLIDIPKTLTNNKIVLWEPPRW